MKRAGAYVGENHKPYSLLSFRENYIPYYERQLAQVVRATGGIPVVAGSTPVLFLLSFNFTINPGKVRRKMSRSKLFISRNGSTILTCIGGIGVVATAIFTAKAAPKAAALLEQAKKEKGDELTKLEVVSVAAPVYIPAIMTGVTTLACIFGANILNKRQQASLISAYALLDNSYKEYKKKVEELYGEEAVKEIRSEITKDHYDGSVKPSDGTMLFYDFYSGRYFESTIEKVREAEYAINRQLHVEDGVYLNDFYEKLGLDPIDIGYNAGWSQGLCMEMYWKNWIDFVHETVVIDGETYEGMECCIITMKDEPVIDFLDYH